VRVGVKEKRVGYTHPWVETMCGVEGSVFFNHESMTKTPTPLSLRAWRCVCVWGGGGMLHKGVPTNTHSWCGWLLHKCLLHHIDTTNTRSTSLSPLSPPTPSHSLTGLGGCRAGSVCLPRSWTLHGPPPKLGRRVVGPAQQETEKSCVGCIATKEKGRAVWWEQRGEVGGVEPESTYYRCREEARWSPSTGYFDLKIRLIAFSKQNFILHFDHKWACRH
jgi:hypothetical protein